MRQESRNLPVVIVAGMHTDARRQVVEQLLRAVPGSVALHHDLSTANQGSVRRIVRDVSGELDSGTAPWSTTARAARCARTCCPSWSA